MYGRVTKHPPGVLLTRTNPPAKPITPYKYSGKFLCDICVIWHAACSFRHGRLVTLRTKGVTDDKAQHFQPNSLASIDTGRGMFTCRRMRRPSGIRQGGFSAYPDSVSHPTQ